MEGGSSVDMPRHNKYECNYLLFLEANSKNFKILAMADGGTGLVNGKGEVGETKEEREGVPFHGFPLAGTHHGGQIWLEKGAAAVCSGSAPWEAVVRRRDGNEEQPGRCSSVRGG